LLAVKKEEAGRAEQILKTFNKNASIIGKVTNLHPKKVIINSAWQTQRFLDMPSGELLPRIC
jgi:hydrogenase expression/formation protein HypE